MEKIDLKKVLKEFYSTKKNEAFFVEMPDAKYLMIDGTGDPNNSEQFGKCVEALYGVAYTIKFKAKESDNDFTVMPLEGLWWVEDMNLFSDKKKDNWKWTLMIMMPDFVTDEMFIASKKVAFEKKKNEYINQMRFEVLKEGKCGQIVHTGSYSSETENIQKLHAFIRENGYELTGKHHEIYMSDPRKVEVDKMKTIIRQPMKQPDK